MAPKAKSVPAGKYWNPGTPVRTLRAAVAPAAVQPPRGVVRQLELPMSADTSRPIYIHPVALDEALRLAAEKGVPYGHDIARGNYHSLNQSTTARSIMESPYRDQLLRDIHALLTDKGIPADALVPYSQGAYTTAFLAPDVNEVVKLTRSGSRQFKSRADGVWGVLSSRVAEDLPTPAGANIRPPGQLAIGIAPRAKIGVATDADLKTLESALREQGWTWFDNHVGNIGMLPGDEYRPVVIDPSDVEPSGVDQTRYPFVPPKGPLYSGLIAALSAAGGAGVANAGETKRQLVTPSPTIGTSVPVPPEPGRKPEGMFDFSMTISPDEWKNWETVKEYGYGGPKHQAFIKAIDQALDVPAIPEKFVASMGIKPENLDLYFPGYKGGDLTMRQYITAAPLLMVRNASSGRHIVKTLIEDLHYLGKNKDALQSNIHAALTGSSHDRGDPYTQQAVNALLSAVKAGTPGGGFEDDPARPQAEFDELQAKHGSKAHMMLTPGGENNHRRLAVYELASALQDGEHRPQGFTTTQAIGNFIGGAFEPTKDSPANERFFTMMQKSAPLSRIDVAMQKWNTNKKGIIPASQSDQGPPATVSGKMSEEYDPRTWSGFFKQMYNPSYAAGRNIFTPVNATIGDLGTTLSLIPHAMKQDGPAGLVTPFMQQTDVARRAGAITPVIPGNMTRDEFKGLVDSKKQHDAAMGDWWGAYLTPAQNDMHGYKRTFTPPVVSAVAGTPQELASDPYQAAAIGLGAKVLGGKIPASVVEETGENITYGPAAASLESGDISAGLRAMTQPPQTNQYLLPREDGEPVNASDPDYWQQIDRSADHYRKKAAGRYDLWRNPKQISGLPPVNAG